MAEPRGARATTAVGAPARRPGRRRSVSAVGALLLGLLVAVAPMVGPTPGPVAGALPSQEEPAVTLPAPTADPDEVRAEAERILSGEQFGGGEEGEPGGGRADGGAGGEPDEPREPQRAELPDPPVFDGMGPIAQALMWILVAALVALAVWIVVRALRARAARARDDADEDDSPWVEEEAADAIDRPADEWLDLAERAEADGAWREGLLYRYRSLVVTLVDRRVVPPVPGRTVGEHRVDVAASAPSASDAFATAARLFERAWYGDRPTGAEERDAFRHQVDRIDTATAGGGAAELVGASAGSDVGAAEERR